MGNWGGGSRLQISWMEDVEGLRVWALTFASSQLLCLLSWLASWETGVTPLSLPQTPQVGVTWWLEACCTECLRLNAQGPAPTTSWLPGLGKTFNLSEFQFVKWEGELNKTINMYRGPAVCQASQVCRVGWRRLIPAGQSPAGSGSEPKSPWQRSCSVRTQAVHPFPELTSS